MQAMQEKEEVAPPKRALLRGRTELKSMRCRQMKSLFYLLGVVLLLPLGLALRSESEGKMSSRSKSWMTLGDAKFDHVPYEAFEEYMGSKGASWYEWDIWHNFEGNSTSNNDESFWLLGFATRDFKSFQKKVLSRGGSPSSEGGLSCAERIAKAKIALIVNAHTSNGTISRNGYKYHYHIKKEVVKDTLGRNKPRTVFWSFANCKAWCEPTFEDPYCGGTILVDYMQHQWLENYDTNKKSELGFGLQGIDTTLYVSSVIQVFVLTPFAVSTYISLWARKMNHPTVTLLMSGIFIYAIGAVMLTIATAVCASYGRLVVGWLIALSVATYLCGHLCFVSLFLLLSGGWTITRRKLKVVNRARLAFFTTTYFILSLISLVSGAIARVEENTRAVYNSGAGGAAGIVLVLGWLHFMRGCSITVSKWPEYKVFYLRLRLVGTLYVMTMPTLFLVGSLVSHFFAFKIILVGTSIAYILAQIVLVAMYNPYIFPSAFPFHATIGDMKLYKLKKKKDRILQLADSLQDTGAGAGLAGEGSVMKPGGSSSDSNVSVVSFTGGVGSVTLNNQDHSESSLIDSKLRPPSYFDKVQIRKVKEISKEVDAAIAHLNEYSLALHAVLEEVDTSNVKGDEAFEKAVRAKTFQGELAQAVLSMHDTYTSLRTRGKGDDLSSESFHWNKGLSRNSGGATSDEGANGDAGFEDGLTRWREAGMANRPRYLRASSSQRSGMNDRGGDRAGAPQYPSLDLAKDDEETMEGQGVKNSDAEAFVSSIGGSNIHRKAAISTPGGRGDGNRGWRTPGYDVTDASTKSGGEGVLGESPPSGPGKESEEAQRRQWEDVERQQLNEVSGGASYFGKSRNSPVKRVPLSPAPVGSASPYTQLDMTNVKRHAKRRMNAAGGESDASSEVSEEERGEKDI